VRDSTNGTGGRFGDAIPFAIWNSIPATMLFTNDRNLQPELVGIHLSLAQISSLDPTPKTLV
jgi:hypothetical protein